MDTHRFFVEKLRFHLKEKDKLVFVGWFFDGSTREHDLKVYLDGKELPLKLQINRGAEVRQKYIRSINEIEEEVVGIITLPEGWQTCRKLRVIGSYRGEENAAYTVSTAKLRRIEKEIAYYIESCHRGDGKVTVTGWCMAGSETAHHADGEAKLEILNGNRQPISGKVEHFYRRDLLAVFPECDKEARPGFLVQANIPDGPGETFYLAMRQAERVSIVRLKKWDEGTKLQYVAGKLGDAARYLERNGLSATLYKIRGKLRREEGNTYDNWRKKYTVTSEELEQQRRTTFTHRPKFSVVVPLYETDLRYLKEMIESVCAQTYTNWELVMADGSTMHNMNGTDQTVLTSILSEYAARDSRIRYVTIGENRGISGNTNVALKMADGDFIVLADHDDIVPPNALYEFAREINECPDVDMLYSDEDKVSMDGKKYFEPHFKPDFNLDLLCSVNYICHLFAVRCDVAERAGVFRSEYDGAQDLDFILRCAEQSECVRHVPKILYHWRCHMNSTAANPESKRYAFEAGRRAIEAHYERLGIPAKVEHAEFYGMYRTRYEWREEPLVSVIIPNKDHADDLRTCIESIDTKSDYRNLEYIIVENNSTEQATFDYYRRLETEYSNVRVVRYEGDFNYSRINNFGARAASGDYFLLLNNDTEMIDAGGIREMLGFCMREDVGAVGAKLLYADDTIQHAGVVVGFGGTAGHAWIGKSRYDTGYFGRILCAQDYSAVTAACMMTKRFVFESVGGLTEELAVAFNDVDYCLKVRGMGYLIVYDPYAEFYHYESKSRGYEDTPAKVERFNGEVEILLSRWRTLIEAGDPYYNPNLTLDNSDFSLRR